MVLISNVCQVEPCFGPFGDNVSLGADRCTVCAEHTIGLEIILDAPVGGDVGQVDARLSLFGDSANLDSNRCKVCIERTHFGRPDGTPT
jgi:hypothetical protein